MQGLRADGRARAASPPCISTARLNAATNAAGTLDELYVIAAAVIGGTSLAGGVGTIAGAMLGALVMQSLQSGMVLIGVDTPAAEHRRRRSCWSSPSGSTGSTAAASTEE